MIDLACGFPHFSLGDTILLLLLFVVAPALVLSTPGALLSRHRVRKALRTDASFTDPRGVVPLDLLLAGNNTLLTLLVVVPPAVFFGWERFAGLPRPPLGYASYALGLGATLFMSFLGWRCRHPATRRLRACRKIVGGNALTLVGYVCAGLTVAGFFGLKEDLVGPSLVSGLAAGGFLGLLATSAGTAIAQIGIAR